jgi:AAA15 family ATPase/GTPase
MNEKIAEIKFTRFRGIPEKTFRLLGQNYVIFGGTGRGKSSIVDGIEFFFKGFISRFRGEGTGYIRESEAIQHVN